MSGVTYDDILRHEGFERIGQLAYRLHIDIWWNPAPDRLLQVLIIPVGRSVLIRSDKTYYLRSISAEGETWARDISALNRWLIDHFPEIRLSFSHCRDVPAALAELEARRRIEIESPTQQPPSLQQVAQLQQQLQTAQANVWQMRDLLALSSCHDDLLSHYAQDQNRQQQAQVEQLKAKLDPANQRLGLLGNLQKEFQHKGAAAVFAFNISSNLQLMDDPVRFADALRAVVKELADQHRYQVRQTLSGGRLNIQISEASEPSIAWLEVWLGGLLSPTQLQRLNLPVEYVQAIGQEHVMVTPTAPIVVKGHVRHAEKHIAARVVSDMVSRMDKTAAEAPKRFDAERIPPEAMPLRLGLEVDDAGRTLGPAVFPLSQFVHTTITGATGSGKSFASRVLVEEAWEQKDLSILLLDPGNQASGLLLPESRPQILQRYAEFNMNADQARGFPFTYFAPGLAIAPPLPADLSALATGRCIVSFKMLDDEHRCHLARQILQAVFEKLSADESDLPRLLIMVDEAHLLTRRRVAPPAKAAAAEAELAIDRIVRLGRKHGIVLVLVSQSIRDFGHELASVRQQAAAKIFLRSADREIEAAAEVIGDGRAIAHLPTGVALIFHSDWGVHRVRVRAPYSMVRELDEAQLRQLLDPANRQVHSLSHEAKRLLALIAEHRSSPRPLNLSQLAALTAITSKRKLNALVDELQQAGAIRTRTLPERGQPRVIEVSGP